MGWKRHVSSFGEARAIALIGAVEIAIAAARSVVWTAGDPLTQLYTTNLLIVVPGLVLLYGGYDIARSDIHDAALPLVVGRTVTGIVALLAVVVLLAIGGDVSQPFYTPVLGGAIGSVAGFGFGLQEARAYSEAYEAEEARQRAEAHQEQLRTERDLRERIVQTSPIGIVILDSDGGFRMVNEHAASIMGVSKDRLESLTHYDAPMFEATDADGESVEAGMFERILAEGEPIYDVERQITRADGSRRWLSVNGAPLTDQDGGVSALIFAFKDITARKQNQQRLEESNERLEQFAYAASHDLQEPLRMVSTYLQLIESRYEDELDADGREFIGFAVDGADRMRAMIDGLLAYSRVETEGEPFEPVDLNAVLGVAREDLRMAIEESDATITADPLPTVEGDQAQLRQVFQNLLSNAIEYSGDEPPVVHVSAEQGDGEWTISMADEGIGIEADDPDRIFEVFQRLHSRDEHEGTGIGLALCERIVERHGGEIWVEPTDGQGTTISFTVPASQEQSTDPFARARSPVSEGAADTGEAIEPGGTPDTGGTPDPGTPDTDGTADPDTAIEPDEAPDPDGTADSDGTSSRVGTVDSDGTPDPDGTADPETTAGPGTAADPDEAVDMEQATEPHEAADR